MNKYEDAMLTMKLVKRDYKNDGFEQVYLDNVIDLLRQAKKQEKLLELYKKQNAICEKLMNMEFSLLGLDDSYYELELSKIKDEIEKLELENDK